MTESTDAEIVAVMRDGYNCRYNDEQDHIDFARAVLAKWGTPPAAAPVPDEREAFEAWMQKTGPRFNTTDRKRDGRYWSSHTQLMWESWQARASRGQAPAGAVERGDLSDPCPRCHAGPYYLCGHYQNPVARQAPSVLEDAARWDVLDGGGAQVTDVASLSEAMAYLTPERLSRQWCAVCVVDQSNLPLAALAQPAAPAGEDAKERAKP